MKKTSVLAAAAALALSGVAYAGAPAAVVKGVIHAPAQHGQSTVYDQNDNDAGVGITSQNFESTYDAYDNQGADDFTLTGKAKVTGIVVTGSYYNGSGPAASLHVTFYKASGGKPGAVVADFPAVVPTDSFGSFTAKLPKAKFKKGTFFVSVQANMDFAVGGQWAWETRSVQNGGPAQWQNPGDGFATGCTTWGDLTTCIPSGEGPDYMFTLTGK